MAIREICHVILKWGIRWIGCVRILWPCRDELMEPHFCITSWWRDTQESFDGNTQKQSWFHVKKEDGPKRGRHKGGITAAIASCWMNWTKLTDYWFVDMEWLCNVEEFRAKQHKRVHVYSSTQTGWERKLSDYSKVEMGKRRISHARPKTF